LFKQQMNFQNHFATAESEQVAVGSKNGGISTTIQFLSLIVLERLLVACSVF